MEDINDDSEMLSDDHASNIIRNVHEARPCGKMTSPTLFFYMIFHFHRSSSRMMPNRKSNLLKFVAYSNENSIPPSPYVVMRKRLLLYESFSRKCFSPQQLFSFLFCSQAFVALLFHVVRNSTFQGPDEGTELKRF